MSITIWGSNPMSASMNSRCVESGTASYQYDRIMLRISSMSGHENVAMAAAIPFCMKAPIRRWVLSNVVALICRPNAGQKTNTLVNGLLLESGAVVDLMTRPGNIEGRVD